MIDNTKLTDLTSSGGCAAKLDAESLSSFISTLSYYKDDNLIIGIENFSDCGVYKINDTHAIVQSVDFFPPMVDNPNDFGAIAAANALSDIYACGATPVTALNLVAFPQEKLSQKILEQIMSGATKKLAESKTVLLGGHSIKDSSLMFGFAVTGIIEIEKIITNSNARIGDHLILTKPIGIGLVNTAVKMKLNISIELINETVELMKQLNNKASELIKKHKVNACTDVTGFSLIGHGYEMASASKVSMRFFSNLLPVIRNIDSELIRTSRCGGTIRNYKHYHDMVKKNSVILDDRLLYDPQTSGGLLISVSPDTSEKLNSELRECGYLYSSIIGEVIEKTKDEVIIE